jgi:predicted transcriptional regulator YdeE
MLKIYILIFLCIMNIAFQISSYIEPFSFDDTFLFILQTSKTNYTIKTLPTKCKVGYTNESLVQIFKGILDVHNIDKLKIEYIKSDDLSKVDILLHTDQVNKKSNTSIIEYYHPKSRLHPTLSNYRFSVYNSNNNSFMLLIPKKIEEYKRVLSPKISFDPRYNFVIETSINGTFKEKDLNTNEIRLKGNTLENIEVKVGDLILITNQQNPSIEGEYVVVAVSDSYITLHMHIELPEKKYSCFQDFKKLHNLQSKTQCLYDNSNNIWDHTCRRHLECPEFIDQDSHCEFGLCKIPYYKQQISYRQYK